MYNDIFRMIQNMYREQIEVYDKFLTEEFLKRGYTIERLKDSDTSLIERPGRDVDTSVDTYIVDNVPVLTVEKKTTLISDPENHTYNIRFEFRVLEGENTW